MSLAQIIAKATAYSYDRHIFGEGSPICVMHDACWMDSSPVTGHLTAFAIEEVMVKFSESMRVKNLLGALSIGISDKITARAAEQVGYSGEAAAAITQLGTMPRLTIDALSHALKLSHSATVRLVAKLEGAGLIKRADSEDRREVRLLLTKSGKAVMMRILKEREQMLDEITKGMSPADLAELGRLVEPLLRRITKSQDEAIYLCRYCDEGRCPQDRCPTIPCH